MTWYQVTVTPDGAVGKLGREKPLVFFDRRTLQQLHDDLKLHGGIEVERASTERRVESRGMMMLRDPHVMIIQERRDLHYKYPDGPPPFVWRDFGAKPNSAAQE